MNLPHCPPPGRLRRRAAVVCLALSAALAVPSVIARADSPQIKAEYVQKIEAALPDKAPAAPKKPRKVLVFTLATGFVHSSIPVGAKTFEMMGKKTRAYETVISADRESLSADNLKQFDAIVMESTTGDPFAPTQKKMSKEEEAEFKKLPADEQKKRKSEMDQAAAKDREASKAHTEELRESFLNFVREGKGVVGVHAASDCCYNWKDYGDLIGGYFNGHPFQHVAYRIDDSQSPLTSMFPPNFELNDETYTFKMVPYSREKLHVLCSIDLQKSKMKPDDKDPAKFQGENRADHDYGLSWVHPYGKGRVFYAAHGHREEIYWNPVMLKHYLAGLQYALGDLEANDSPSGPRTADAGAAAK